MKISIALCTYNGEKYLPEQLDSILAQTRLPDEIVVCDDNSIDATARVVNDYAARSFVPIRFYRNATSLRTIKNFEKAVALCGGDIVALCDQDDVWRADKLAIFERVFRENPNAGLVFSDARLVDENLRELGRTNWQVSGFDSEKQRLLTTGGNAALVHLLRHPVVWGCTMAFRARYKKLLLPFPDDLPFVLHDAWIAWLIRVVSEIALVPECLVDYRQHREQQWGQEVETPQASAAADSQIKAVAKHQAPSMASVGDAPAAIEAIYRKEQIERMNALKQRLELHAREFAAADAIKFLDSRLRHFVNRRELRRSRAKRIGFIAGELLSLRYHRHSNGLKSAVKDLISRVADDKNIERRITLI